MRWPKSSSTSFINIPRCKPPLEHPPGHPPESAKNSHPQKMLQFSSASSRGGHPKILFDLRKAEARPHPEGLRKANRPYRCDDPTIKASKTPKGGERSLSGTICPVGRTGSGDLRRWAPATHQPWTRKICRRI